jgi:hypothetical protein
LRCCVRVEGCWAGSVTGEGQEEVVVEGSCGVGAVGEGEGYEGVEEEGNDELVEWSVSF